MTLAAALLALALPAAAAPAKIAAEDASALALRLREPGLPPAERPLLLRSLQRLRDPAQLPVLFELARSTGSPLDVAQSAWTALTETALDAPKQAKTLVPGWLASADAEARFRCLELLKEGVWDPSYVPLVRRALAKDPDEENRAEAALVLGGNEVHDAKPDLLRAKRDRSKAVREAAARALEDLATSDEAD